MRLSLVGPRRRWLPLAAAASLAARAGGAPVSAGALPAGPLVHVPDNPLAATAACAPQVAQQTAQGSRNNAGAEVEPYIAADPTNSLHLVGTFQQDRWNDGGSNGL